MSAPAIPPTVTPVDASAWIVRPRLDLVDLFQKLGELKQKPLPDEPRAELGDDEDADHAVRQDALEPLSKWEIAAGIVVALVAGREVGVTRVARAVAHDEEVDDEHHRDDARGDDEDAPEGEALHENQPPMTRARAQYPDEIIAPKNPPRTPRSRTWNQAEFTLTTESAPKLWKYMFTA